jgi:hypothetical protein
LFPVYVGKCWEAVHNWLEKFSEGRSKFADDARPGAEVAETTLKGLLCYGFRRTGKAIDKLVEDTSRNKCFPPPRFEYHMFYVLYPFVTFLLNLLRTNI